MAPTGDPGADIKTSVEKILSSNEVVIFSKTTCPYCTKVKSLFRSVSVVYYSIDLDKLENGAQIQDYLLTKTGQKTVPNIFIKGEHIGGYDSVSSLHDKFELMPKLTPRNTDYKYDLVVVGGGSGGLACSKEAANLGFRVACLDFVKPSPRGSSWGLGGTCVNVGCIPKKLMHTAAILKERHDDAQKFGWEFPNGNSSHNWETMKSNVQNYIGSLNWGYRVALRDKKVDYINAYGEFIDKHTMKITRKNGKTEEITSNFFVIATGGRPTYPDIPGALEYGITSDDIFSLDYNPGKTLVIGASYVSLECAGFLAGLGLDVTIYVRSILLRGFDQQMAEIIGDYMAKHNVKFVRPCVPSKIEKIKDGEPGLYRVTANGPNGEIVEEFNTVLFAVGRKPCTSDIGLSKVQVEMNKKGEIIVDSNERTSVENIYAVGDICQNRPELTPVAIQSGKLLARRMCNRSAEIVDYNNIPTTVFTPLEYGAIGLSEEDALEKYGKLNIEVYHQNFWPLEWTVAERESKVCYMKLICLLPENERVVGLHVAGPNAGEITQGWALGMRMGATKKDFEMTIGIHPTSSETFTTMNITKRSGKDAGGTGC